MNDKCACTCGTIYDINFNFCPNCGRQTSDNIKDSEEEDNVEIEQKDSAGELDKGFEYDISSIKTKNIKAEEQSANEHIEEKTKNNIGENVKPVVNGKDTVKKSDDELIQKYKGLLKMEKYTKMAICLMCILTILIYIIVH